MFYAGIKRVGDIIIGLIGLVILIPVTLVIKLAYILTGDWHSIFYTQERIGKNGKVFKIYKYRSMVWDAEAELKRLMKADPKICKEYTKYKKLANDPRITKIGKIIRRYSIDEAPQFLNLVIGNMSLVGNRPYLLGEKTEMGIFFDKIVSTKPGITGLWQVSSHNKMLFEERLKIESAYEQCFSYDFNIIIDTFKSLFGGSNQ